MGSSSLFLENLWLLLSLGPSSSFPLPILLQKRLHHTSFSPPFCLPSELMCHLSCCTICLFYTLVWFCFLVSIYVRVSILLNSNLGFPRKKLTAPGPLLWTIQSMQTHGCKLANSHWTLTSIVTSGKATSSFYHCHSYLLPLLTP